MKSKNTTYMYAQLSLISFAILVLCNVACTQTKALVQEPAESVVEEELFAYAKSTQNTKQLKSHTIKAYREEVVKAVLEDLIEARGEFRMQRPGFTMSNKATHVAWFNPRKVEIGIENKAYEVCTSFGKDSLNAIAALLGHELTHYYDKHDWSRHFARENIELVASKRIAKADEGLKNETQADYLGGFLGYSAGYNTLGIMPKLLKSIYTAYDLPGQLSGYPSLEEREKIANKSMKKLNELAAVYDMATYLTLIGNYEASQQYYQFILKEFQSREIYNNLGTTMLLESLHYFEQEEFKFILPIQLDGESRLSTLSRGSSDKANSIAKRENLIRLAIEHFETAIRLDSDYTLGYINIAASYILLADLEEAEYYLRKAKRINNKNKNTSVSSSIWTLEGVIEAVNDHVELAEEKFKKAIANDYEIAKINLAILKGEFILQKSQNTFLPSAQVEFIENTDLEELLGDIQVDTYLTLSKTVSFGIKNLPASKIYIHLLNEGESYALVQVTDQDYSMKTNSGVGIDTPIDDVKNMYQENSQFYQSGPSLYQVIPEKGIVFKYNSMNTVDCWAVYYTQFD